MLNYLFELLLFAGKAVIVVLTIGAVLLVLVASVSSLKHKENAKAGGSSRSSSQIVLINLSRRKERQKKQLQKMLKKIDPDERLKREAEDDKKGGLFSFLGGKKKKHQHEAEAEKTQLSVVQQSRQPAKAEALTADKTAKAEGESAAEIKAELETEQAEEVMAAAEPEDFKSEAQQALKQEEAQTEAALEQSEAQKNKAEADTAVKPHSALDKKKARRQEKLQRLSKLEAEGVFCPRNVFVINFNGSVNGSEVKKLRRQIDALLMCADKRDEAVVLLTSPGGMVNSYGLLSSQLMRIRNKGIFLTVCVDSVAASGGYLMACVANKIVAAPFAYIGSIGVVAGIPNFHRLMDKYDVDYEQVTAGRYKRTLTMLGENTEEGRAKFKEELEAIHERFKEQVLKFRPQLDIDKVATGEHWLALDALKLGLIDEIAASEDYLSALEERTYNNMLLITFKKKPKDLRSRLRDLMSLKALSRMGGQDFLERRLQNDEPYRHIR